MPKEVKLMLDEAAWDVLKARADEESRSVMAQAKYMMEKALARPRQPKPKRFVGVQVYDDKLQQFVSADDFEGRN